MAYKPEVELLTICDHLKKTYLPKKDSGFFFDLSREYFVVHLISTSDEMAELVCHFQVHEIPFALIEYFEKDPFLFVDGTTFYKDVNLRTQQVTAYKTNIRKHISIVDLQR